MSVYIDSIVCYSDSLIKENAKKYGSCWCHMYGDTEDELDRFAVKIGLRIKWKQGKIKGIKHYDLTPGRRKDALRNGAINDSNHVHFFEIVNRFKEK